MEENDIMEKLKKIDLMFILLILAFALLYGTVIFNDSLWGDEAYTMLTIKNSFSEILKITARRCPSATLLFYCQNLYLMFGIFRTSC